MKLRKFIGYFILCSFFLSACNSNSLSNNKSSNVPDYVYETLQVVEKTGKKRKGYVGGRTFQNREKRLPKKDENGKKIKYKEWDVHKKVKGKNRGAERLVTGSDGNAYYTKDHYKTFIKIIIKEDEDDKTGK